VRRDDSPGAGQIVASGDEKLDRARHYRINIASP
jgi:hypothetical protein